MTIGISDHLNKKLAEFSRLNRLEYDPEFLPHVEELCIGLTIENSYSPFYLELKEQLSDIRVKKAGKVVVWNPKTVDLLWKNYLSFLMKEHPEFIHHLPINNSDSVIVECELVGAGYSPY